MRLSSGVGRTHSHIRTVEKSHITIKQREDHRAAAALIYCSTHSPSADINPLRAGIVSALLPVARRADRKNAFSARGENNFLPFSIPQEISLSPERT